MDLFLSPSVSLRPPGSATSRLIHTALYAPDYPPSFPVLDCLSTWTDVHSRRPPPPLSTLAIFSPSTCYPGPSQSLHPRSACRFCRLLPSPLVPLSVPSTSLISLSTPVGAPFLVPPVLRHFLEPLPSPAVLDLQNFPCRYQGG